MPEGELAFAFRWGAVVLVGLPPAREAAVMAELLPLISQPLAPPMEEVARVVGGSDEDGVDPNGTIQLRDLSLPRLSMVADALAKSVALAQQEATLAQTLDGMEPVVTGLRIHGRLAVSSRALLRSIGGALSARSRATARIQAEDKPDILWDHPELERLHARLADEFELSERSAALDCKLSLIGEGTAMLLALIEARRSLGLEIAIVALISIELLTSIYGLLFK